MVALAASILLALYLVIPGFIFRFVFGFFVPLRTFVWTRAEEIYKAVITAALPLVLATLSVWYLPLVKTVPLSFPDSSDLRGADYKLVLSAIYSEDRFRASEEAFWSAFVRSSRRQGRLLFWYYGFVIGEAVLLSYLVLQYGKLKGNKLYSWLADTLFLPNISQWHVLLTPFIFPGRKAILRADVLCSDGTLYKGVVSQHFLDTSGGLSGLILTDSKRFRRQDYVRDKEKDIAKDPDTYWRVIPGAKLYVFADKIVNINLNYETESLSESAVSEAVKERTGKPGATFSITITVGKPGEKPPTQGPTPGPISK